MQARLAREALYKLQPATPQALIGLGKAVAESGLEKSLVELVKIRASQINGCAFCLHMHFAEARKLGESQERLDLVSAWREAPGFSARERAALAWTEALTLVAQDHVPDAVYAEAKAQFTDQEFANLTAAIVTINAWNRIAVAFRFVPPVKGA
ncbi:MAG: carboxymuconolactone decarboxylase family protein [Proteobacteria bacterium]|nr:carboxymuconolactone decarboxylase family protein [Pseudomonadota bacterium]